MTQEVLDRMLVEFQENGERIFKSLKDKRKYNTYPEISYNNSEFVFKMLIILCS